MSTKRMCLIAFCSTMVFAPVESFFDAFIGAAGFAIILITVLSTLEGIERELKK